MSTTLPTSNPDPTLREPESLRDGLPPMAWRLGYGGLIPFVLGALLVWAVTDEALGYVAAALAAYGAVIVSFLGGIHWGLVMKMGAAAVEGDAAAHSVQASSALVWGVMPSLVAWLGVLMPPHAGLVILGLALVGCYLVDRRRYAAQGLGAWLTLRFRLTAVAALSCFLAAAGT